MQHLRGGDGGGTQHEFMGRVTPFSISTTIKVWWEEGTQQEFVGRKDNIYNIMDAPFSISGRAAMEHLHGDEGGEDTT